MKIKWKNPSTEEIAGMYQFYANTPQKEQEERINEAYNKIIECVGKENLPKLMKYRTLTSMFLEDLRDEYGLDGEFESMKPALIHAIASHYLFDLERVNSEEKERLHM